MEPVTCTQLVSALQSVKERLPRHRPLARVQHQFLADLAALLSGLRVVLMLDYAPGTTPEQLAQVLQPLQQQLPDWTGCLLELEGCCYLANSTQLLQQLAELAAYPGSWPAVVSFSGPEPRVQQDVNVQLQQQVRQLHAAVSTGLALQAEHAVRTAAGPLIQLGKIQGLPAMPTLNGMLLGYPVVYHVRDVAEAAVASRMLSGSQLQLHRMLAVPSRQLATVLAGDDGVQLKKQSAGSSELAAVLMSFTVPEMVQACVVNKVRLCLQRLSSRQAMTGDVWQKLEHVDVLVGPQAVSL